MINVRFNLRKKPNKAMQQPLHAVFLFKGKQMEIPTRMMVRKSEFDSKTQMFRNELITKSIHQDFLQTIKLKILQFYQFGNNKDLSRDKFRLKLTEYLFPDEDKKLKSNNVLKCVDDFLLDKKAGNQETYQKYYYFFASVFKDFVDKNYNNIKFSDFDLVFYKKFKTYLFDERKNDNNSVSKSIDRLKVFLNWCTENEFNNNATYLMFNRGKYKIPTYEPDNATLKKDELIQLIKTPLENNRLEKVRKKFIFMCLTGQRKMDYKNLEWHDIDGGYWHLRQQKEFNKRHMIPLHPICLDILDDFKNESKPILLNSKFNSDIKKVFKELGITKMFTKTRISNGKRTEVTKPKYQFISAHSARRTIVTLSGEFGITPEIGSKITGHSNLDVYKLYDKRGDLQAANKFIDIWNRELSSSILKK